jgi:hypothetical protein
MTNRAAARACAVNPKVNPYFGSIRSGLTLVHQGPGSPGHVDGDPTSRRFVRSVRGERDPRLAPVRRSFGAMEAAGIQMRFAANQEIFGEGEPAEYGYKVTKGAVRACKILCDGRRQIGGFYLRGDIFGLEIGKDSFPPKRSTT